MWQNMNVADMNRLGLGVFITNFELIPQQTFTCVKSTIEILEKCVKYVQS